jgi:hypothetical protein
VSDISTGLIEFAEHKRLLFERIRHKLGDVNAGIEQNPNTQYLPCAQVNITDEALSNLYIESAETIELHISLKKLKITDDKVKMKWMGLYTMALAKETHARIKFSVEHGNGMNNTITEFQLSEYNNLLAESKEEKTNLINLLNEFNKT